MITCFLRYIVDPAKLAEFEHYGRTWIRLVAKFGGTHHGYFLPLEGQAGLPFSFPGLGAQGASNVAVALFSFPSMEAYNAYRSQAAQDEECKAIMAYFEETQCFLSYERSFMQPVFEQANE